MPGSALHWAACFRVLSQSGRRRRAASRCLMAATEGRPDAVIADASRRRGTARLSWPANGTGQAYSIPASGLSAVVPAAREPMIGSHAQSLCVLQACAPKREARSDDWPWISRPATQAATLRLRERSEP